MDMLPFEMVHLPWNAWDFNAPWRTFWCLHVRIFDKELNELCLVNINGMACWPISKTLSTVLFCMSKSEPHSV